MKKESAWGVRPPLLDLVRSTSGDGAGPGLPEISGNPWKRSEK